MTLSDELWSDCWSTLIFTSWTLPGDNSYFSVYSAIFGMVTINQPTNQVILEQACS